QDRPSPDDSSHEIEDVGSDGRRRVRRFEHLSARIAALRLSSPREKGIQADIGALAVLASDPALRVTELQGRIRVAGDSVDADLRRVGMPGSRYSLKGRLRWPRDTVRYDLTARADSATLTDLKFVSRRFPAGAVLAGDVGIRSHGGRLLEVHIDPLDLAYPGGRLPGRLPAPSAAGSGLVAVRATGVPAGDLRTVRRLAPAVTLHGVLDAAGTLTGPYRDAQFSGTLRHRDPAAGEAAPTSSVRGTVRLDMRGDTLGVFADVTADSLSFNGLR